MKDLLGAVVSWRALIVALLIFGFAPDMLLRLIVLAFPKDDPRRAELRGELHAVPRWERPFWVAEQFEVALCEGLAPRVARGAIRSGAWLRVHLTLAVTASAATVTVLAGILAGLTRRSAEALWTVSNLLAVGLAAITRVIERRITGPTTALAPLVAVLTGLVVVLSWGSSRVSYVVANLLAVGLAAVARAIDQAATATRARDR